MRSGVRSKAIVLSLMFAGTTLVSSVPSSAGAERKETGNSQSDRWPRSPLAPKGAPNILIIMTDDVGFGTTSTFGGPVPTAAFDRLAGEGLRFNRFHTTAMCSPTRASLLTGREPHNVAMGVVTNFPTGFDGYTTVIPDSAGTIADILKAHGYNTSMFGKGHVTPEWEMSIAGPYDRWPVGLGFEYFYGFLGADTSMWNPNVVENTVAVQPDTGVRDYHFEKDMADHAIKWLRNQNAAAPDKPFLMYYAPGLAHTPHHAPKAWIDRFRGNFDQGWDIVREETFARQKAEGIIPKDAELTQRPESMPAWASLTPEQKRVYARLMEAYAGSVAYSDAQTGRVIEEIRRSGEFDNTIIIYIQGDNGSSAEGGLGGLAFSQSLIVGRHEDFAELADHLDDIGTANMYNHFPAAWGWAMNAPFPWWKQVASQEGGTRNGMVISWPKGIAEHGEIRTQYTHVSDIFPTLLELAGVAEPKTIAGVAQQPVDGVSFSYSFNAPDAPSHRRTQVYEMMQNYGIYSDGWMSGTLPEKMPWDLIPRDGESAKVIEPRWTLFNLDRDFSTAHDLAQQNPEKLAELKRLFQTEAEKNHILPIHEPGVGREGMPTLGKKRTHFTYPSGIANLNEDAAPYTIGESFVITASVDVPAQANGVLVAHGGRYGGYSLYLANGRPVFHYNSVGSDQYRIASHDPIGPGDHVIKMGFVADQERAGTPGTVTLTVDGKVVASGRIDRTIAGWVSHTEGFDIGADRITPVSDEYTTEQSTFEGTISEIRFDIDP
ncbi:MAG: sulfatase-like hydrolase/transferase [Novosphingobium sp.]